MLTRRAFLIGAVSAAALAAATPSSGEVSPELAGAFAKIDRFFEAYDEIRKAVDSDEHRVIWVTGQSRSGKTAMAEMLLNDIGRFGSSALHLPTQDAKSEFLKSHNEGDWLVYSVTSGAADLRRSCFKYIVIDQWEGHPACMVSYHDPAKRRPAEYEGDVVDLAYQRTLSFRDSKVIVFSELDPPGWVHAHHIRLAPVI